MSDTVIQAGVRQIEIASSEEVFVLDNLAENGVDKLNITIGRGAKVKYLFLATGKNVISARRELLVGDQAEVEIFQVILDSSCAQLDFVNEIGAAAELRQAVLYIVRQEQKLKVNDRQIFRQPSAKGKFLAEGFIDEKAGTEYLSELIIEEAAQETDARVDLRLNLLGPQARGLMQPALYIKANQVRAGHGASTLNLGAEDLFYLSSRGIKEAEAKKLLIRSSAERFIRAVNHSGWRELIGRSLKDFL